MMVTATAAFMMLMMLVLMVMTAAAAFVMLMMLVLMVMTAAAAFVMVMMLVLMMVTATAAFVMLMMVMFVVMMLQLFQILLNGSLTCHSLQQLLTAQFVPRRNHQGCLLIMLTEQSNGGIQLCLGDGISTGENDGGSGFDLVVIELAKVLHVNLHLACVGNCHLISQDHVVSSNLLHGGNHITELTHAGGFNHDTIGMVLLDHLGQCLAKVAHQAAANAAGIHFGDVDAGVLQEAAIDTDLTELIFNEHQIFACIGFLDHFLDQRCFTGAKKAGVNINLGHKETSC